MKTVKLNNQQTSPRPWQDNINTNAINAEIYSPAYPPAPAKLPSGG